MKTKFMAGLIATLVALVFTVGIAVLMVTVFDMDAENRVPYVIAFAVIAIWTGLYKWLKPKEENQQSSDDDIDIPARRT